MDSIFNQSNDIVWQTWSLLLNSWRWLLSSGKSLSLVRSTCSLSSSCSTLSSFIMEQQLIYNTHVRAHAHAHTHTLRGCSSWSSACQGRCSSLDKGVSVASLRCEVTSELLISKYLNLMEVKIFSQYYVIISDQPCDGAIYPL